MSTEEEARNDLVFEVKTHIFIHAMHYHQCRGEYAYSLTEMMVMWPDIDHDRDHRYLLT